VSPPAVTLISDLLTPKQKWHVCEYKYIYEQNWVKFPPLVFEIWCSQGFRDAQTHSQTDRSEYRVPPAPKVFGAVGIKTKIEVGQASMGLSCSIFA